MADDRPNSDPPPDGMPPAVHRYLSQAFGRLSGQIEGAVRASEHAAQAASDVVERVAVLEWHVFGSKPPPKLGAIAHPALVARVSDNELDADAAAAELLTHHGRIERVERDLRSLRKETRRQSVESLGLAPDTASRRERWGAFMSSRDGRTFVVAIATLILASVTTIATALIATRAPAPSLPSTTLERR